MKQFILITLSASAMLFLLFGHDLSQQWFKDNATLVNIFIGAMALLAALMALFSKPSQMQSAEKSNQLGDVKIDGNENKVEIKQDID